MARIQRFVGLDVHEDTIPAADLPDRSFPATACAPPKGERGAQRSSLIAVAEAGCDGEPDCLRSLLFRPSGIIRGPPRNPRFNSFQWLLCEQDQESEQEKRRALCGLCVLCG